jgi:hypothetical protein
MCDDTAQRQYGKTNVASMAATPTARKLTPPWAEEGVLPEDLIAYRLNNTPCCPPVLPGDGCGN